MKLSEHDPACACDLPTPLYSFSFAPNPGWSHMYARSDEIRQYLEDCADRFGVRAHLRFGADFTGATWVDERQCWLILVGGEPAMWARFLVGGFGGLNRPVFPDIQGLESFGGPVFHTAAWDHSVALGGLRVAVIGTEASAIQLIPQVAKSAGGVSVFQRTAPWIVPKLDRPIGRVEQDLYARIPLTQRAVRGLVFTITEGVGVAITRAPILMRIGERWSRWHLRRAIADPELRVKLTPAYRLGCKRILVSNDFYPALTRENVELVTERIERVDARGLWPADGAHHPADVLVCGTGFRIEEVFSPLDIRGRNGITLNQAWAGGIEAHRETMVAGFLNAALLSGPNTGTGSTSQIYMIEAQIHYVMELLRTLREQRAGAIEVRPAAQAAYNRQLQQQMKRTVWLKGGCNSWYLDEEGVNRTLYPGPSSSFWRSLRRVRQAEYELTPAPTPVTSPPIPVAA